MCSRPIKEYWAFLKQLNANDIQSHTSASDMLTSVWSARQVLQPGKGHEYHGVHLWNPVARFNQEVYSLPILNNIHSFITQITAASPDGPASAPSQVSVTVWPVVQDSTTNGGWIR